MFMIFRGFFWYKIIDFTGRGFGVIFWWFVRVDILLGFIVVVMSGDL